MQLNWLERYYQQSRMEANGRTYEILGFRWCYLGLTQIFGETTLPDTHAIQGMPTLSESGLDTSTLSKMYLATRYYEAVHLACATLTLPIVCSMLLYWHLGLFVYASTLFLLHCLNTFQERYKRCLCWLLLQKPTSEPAQSATASLSTDVQKTAPKWFTPAPFETIKFYRTLGIERLRRIVLNVTTSTMLDTHQRANGEKHSFMSGHSQQHLHTFQQQTQTAEVSHIVGVLLHFPFLWYFLREGFWTGGLYVLLLNFANGYCALLQRYHRVRMARILQRHR